MKPEQAKSLRVTDSSCTLESKERTHVIVVRNRPVEVTFKFGEEKILPFEQGLKFVLPGFKVEEVDGTSLVLPAVPDEAVKASLAVDETVAKFSELNLSALKVRAAQKKGGEMFLSADDSVKEDLIAFLVGTPPAGTAEGEDNDEVDPSKIETRVPATAAETGAPSPDDAKSLATSGAQELARTVLDPFGTFDELKGTGEAGLITESDVKAHIAKHDLKPGPADHAGD